MVRKRSMRGVGWAVVLLGCLAVGVRGQTPAAAGDTVYALRGTVVNGVTGKPVARALVTSADRRVGVLTDSDGRFAIDLKVPAGGGAATSAVEVDGALGAAGLRVGGGGEGLLLTAQKPGYLEQDRPRALSLSEGAAGELKLTLMPGAVVSGRVSASGVDGAADVTVSLLRRQADEDGRMKWVPTLTANTNSRGEFHFAELTPGEYTFETMEWMGDQPLPPKRDAITQQYPPVFYGGVGKLAGATKVHLHYGESVQAEIQLNAATYYPVVVPVLVPAGSPGVGARVVDAGIPSGFGLGYNQLHHAIEGLLPNGQYTVQIFSGGGEGVASATVSLDVAGAPLRTKPVALTPGGSILVRVHDQFTHTSKTEGPAQGPQQLLPGSEVPVEALVQIILHPEDSEGASISEMRGPERGDELILRNVLPGRYFVDAGARRGYVAAMVSGGVDLLQNPLVVGAGGTGAPIDVTLRDDAATVSGTVAAGSGPLQEACLVMLLPTDASGRFAEGVAGEDGNFTVQNVVPGGYRVVAVRGEREVQIAYRDADTMRAYDGKGTTVSVGQGQTVQVDVTLSDVSAASMEEN